MITTNTQDFNVELIENELLNVELTQIDVINNTKQFADSLAAHLIINEVPTQLTAKTFQTANEYLSGNLVVLFNGIKEKYINELTSSTFSFNIDIIASDIIEIIYIKKV